MTTPVGIVTTYTYDANGRRISQTVNGMTTRFYYDRNQIAKENLASAKPLKATAIALVALILIRIL